MDAGYFDRIIDGLIGREGGYVDHPADRGGPTKFGITQSTARRHGYSGAMRDLPERSAREIYMLDYIVAPGIDLLAKRSPVLAAEALDTGVNMGPARGVMMLQRALNALNNGGKDWPDLAKIDGSYGSKSDAALAACKRRRATEQWEDVLLVAMNCQQGDRYLDIIDRDPSQEAFGWGWFRNRVLAPAAMKPLPISDHTSEIALLGWLGTGVLIVLLTGAVRGQLAGPSSIDVAAFLLVLQRIVEAVQKRWEQRSIDRMGQAIANSPADSGQGDR